MKKAHWIGTALFILMALSGYAQPIPGVNIAPFGAQNVWPVKTTFTPILDRMEEGGIQWGRFDLIWWGLCERVPGEYNFTRPDVPGWENWDVDRGIRQMRERGIEPFPILCYGNPLYDNEQGPFSDAGREAFGNYCYAAAERYRDSVTYWEIWNEPNLQQFWGRPPDPADYARLAIVAAARIRQANPDAIIAGGSTSGIDLAFLNTAFEHGLLDAVDIITIHPYRQTAPETINNEVASLRSMIAARTDRPIQIWSGEWGYSTFWSMITDMGQAKVLSRMIVNNLSQGIEMSIWFSTEAFLESPGNTNNAEWGLLDFDLQPRPSFYAMRTLNQRLHAPVRHVSNSIQITLEPAVSNQRVEVFQRGDDKHLTVAVWQARWPLSDTYQGAQTRITLQVPPESQVAAFDGLNGSPVTLNVFRSENRIELTGFRVRDYPTFIDIEQPPTPSALMTY